MLKKNMEREYDSLDTAIQKIFGHDTKVIGEDRIYGGDINDSYGMRLSNGERVFVKTNRIKNIDFFVTESHGLFALQSTRAIGVPTVLGTGIDKKRNISFLLLEYMEKVPHIKNYWEIFGRELAQLHRAESQQFLTDSLHLKKEEDEKQPAKKEEKKKEDEKQPVKMELKKTSSSKKNFVAKENSAVKENIQYGFFENNFIGLNKQKNTPKERWIDFYRDCRLLPQMQMAQSYFDSGMRKKCGKLLDNLERYIREPEFPSLLHGDLWSGNVLCGNDGKAWILDPAVYVGDFETDLAMTQLFGGFPAVFYDAYKEINPIERGYFERRKFYQLYHLLNHLNLFGSAYWSSVAEILNIL